MKLMLVDDEKLTRDRLLRAVDRETPGIGKAEQDCESVRAEKESVRTKAMSGNQAGSALALRLVSAPEPARAEEEKYIVSNFPMDAETPFFTFLIKLHSRNLHTPEMLEETIPAIVEQTLRDVSLSGIHGSKQGYLLFFHVWGENKNDYDPVNGFESGLKMLLGRNLISALELLEVRYHIVFGKTVWGANNIYNSYNSAVIELQNSFFDEENTFRIYEHHDSYEEFSDLEQFDISRKLSNALLQRDQGRVRELLEELKNCLGAEAGNLLPNQVKGLYYKLMTAVNETEEPFQLSAPEKGRDPENIREAVSECESFYELHNMLREQCDALLSLIPVQSEECSAIYLIKDYIAAR